MLTSANLTRGGLRSNFELGVVIRDRDLVRAVYDEFERAWRDAQELTAADITARSAWCKANPPAPVAPAPLPFPTKMPWRPLAAGGRTVLGTDIFAGFEVLDFAPLDPATYRASFADDPVKPEVVKSIQQAITGPVKARLERFYLAIKDYLPDRASLYPHLASRTRVRNFYPSASWLALSRRPERYVTLAQLSVGLFVNQRGGTIFVNFNVGEEYALNEDKGALLDCIEDDPSELAALIGALNPKYELRYCEEDGKVVTLPVRKVKVAELERIARVPRSKLLDLHIQRYYAWADDRESLQSAAIVLEVADQFKILHPIYRRVSKES